MSIRAIAIVSVAGLALSGCNRHTTTTTMSDDTPGRHLSGYDYDGDVSGPDTVYAITEYRTTREPIVVSEPVVVERQPVAVVERQPERVVVRDMDDDDDVDIDVDFDDDDFDDDDDRFRTRRVSTRAATDDHAGRHLSGYDHDGDDASDHYHSIDQRVVIADPRYGRAAGHLTGYDSDRDTRTTFRDRPARMETDRVVTRYEPARVERVAFASPDARILSILHAKNQHEIEIGRLAQERGLSDQVRHYGEMLVRDHTNSDAKVREAATAAGIVLTDPEDTHRILCEEKGKDPAKEKDHLTALRSLSGAEFDREFSNMMAHGHQEMIDLVEDAQDEVRNDRVKVLLAQTLPTLRAHEQQAQRIAAYPEDTDR